MDESSDSFLRRMRVAAGRAGRLVDGAVDDRLSKMEQRRQGSVADRLKTGASVEEGTLRELKGHTLRVETRLVSYEEEQQTKEARLKRLMDLREQALAVGDNDALAQITPIFEREADEYFQISTRIDDTTVALENVKARRDEQAVRAKTARREAEERADQFKQDLLERNQLRRVMGLESGNPDIDRVQEGVRSAVNEASDLRREVKALERLSKDRGMLDDTPGLGENQVDADIRRLEDRLRGGNDSEARFQRKLAELIDHVEKRRPSLGSGEQRAEPAAPADAAPPAQPEQAEPGPAVAPGGAPQTPRRAAPERAAEGL